MLSRARIAYDRTRPGNPALRSRGPRSECTGAPRRHSRSGVRAARRTASTVTQCRLTQQEPSMQSDLYTFSAPVFVRHLHVLSEILLIAEKHATEHNITPATLLSARLYPDMLPFTGQVRPACDTAQRTPAPILCNEPPSPPDRS